MSRPFRYRARILIFLAVLTLWSGVWAEPPRIAVVSAYPPEWAAFVSELENSETTLIAGQTFHTGTLGGKDVVLFLSGISMVNAAMSVQRAIDHFNLEGIVFSGIAGGVNPDLGIGTVVVAEQWGKYLLSVYAREIEQDFSTPDIPLFEYPFPGYGMMYPIKTDVVTADSDEPEYRFWFPVDEGYLDAARTVAENITLTACDDTNNCVSQRPAVLIGGNGVSGAAFVDNADFRIHVFETFEAQVLDMESAAVAHVAYANDLPFIAFRSLSDLAGGNDAENELPTFFRLATQNSSAVVLAFLEALE